MEEVRWGIIGVGDVCEVKSGPAFQQVKDSRLIAVMRRDGVKAADFAQRHHVPKWYDDADKLINDPEVNAIYIATPPNVHEYYTAKAAAAGKPVYVEKPMARNYQECERMVEQCAKRKVPLFIAYYRRRLPNYLKIQSLLAEKAIGDIRYVSITLNKTMEPDIVGAAGQVGNWRTDPEIAGGGYFFDLASHQLDILDFLLGPIEQAHGYASNQAGLYRGEDITTGSWYHKSGVMGQGTWCFATGKSADEETIMIIGSKGHIAFSCFGDQSMTLTVDGKEPVNFEFDIPVNIQQPLIESIVGELTNNGGTCPSKGDSAVRTGWVMDQICKRVD
ncbi:MAG: Gfo/Idh/MocA family oxidoreductase [Cyclobacteriaceae bacterium]